MTNQNQHDDSKKVKNIAAMLYLLLLVFLVGGSYLNQTKTDDNVLQTVNENAPNP